MPTLALDASTYAASVALLHDDEVLAERDVAMRGEREEALMPAVREVLDAGGKTPRELDRIVCGAGPGSFTSLRIAASIAKGIAFAAGRPLYAVSSLLLMVAASDAMRGGGRWLASLDAMRGDRFAQAFEVRGDGRIAETSPLLLVRTEDLAALAESLSALSLGPDQEMEARPRASGVARLAPALAAAAPVSLDSWEPEYGRLAEAQVRWEAAHGRPLAR